MVIKTETPLNWAEWLEQLLALSSIDEQAAFVRGAGLINEAGLGQLLDEAELLVQREPRHAVALAILCETVAAEANAPAVVPRSRYLRAQVHATAGEFTVALALIEQARAEFTQLGLTVEALRTYVGSISVLGELGQLSAALESCQAALDRCAHLQSSASDPLPKLDFVTGILLLNQGGCYERLGRYEDALETYARTEPYFQQADAILQLGMLQNNRGVVLTYLGRVTEALAAYEQAAAIHAKQENRLFQTHALINIGEAHLWLGDGQRSLATFDQARQLLTTAGVPADLAINLRQMADAYLYLNLHPEAFAAYQEAEQTFERLEMRYEQGWALWGMGAARAVQGHFSEATTHLDAAAQIFTALGNTPMHCNVLLEQAGLQQRQGGLATTQALAAQALQLATQQSLPIQQIYAHLRLSDLALPDTAAAEAHLLAAQQLLATLPLPHLRHRLEQRMGRLRRLQGRTTEARTFLETAIQVIEGLRATLQQETLRTSFLRDKLAAYEELMQIHLERNDVEGWQLAFEVAERARARALLDLMTGAIASHLPATTDPAVTMHLQALQADLNAVYNQLLSDSSQPVAGSAPPGERATRMALLNTQALTLEQEIHGLQLLQATTPQAATTTWTQALPLNVIRRQLAEDLAGHRARDVIITYYILDKEVLVFYCTHNRLQVVRNLTQIDVVEGLLTRLSTQWDRFRAGPAFVQRHLAMLTQSAQRILGLLYSELMAPLAPLLTDFEIADTPTRLVLIPHGLLHRVPFQALFDGARYLAERYELVYAPSATIWAVAQQREVRSEGAVLLMGVAAPDIPAVETEVVALAQRLPAATLLVNRQATIAQLIALAPTSRLIHLACHGLFRADNPMFSALKLHDGWFTALDAAKLTLDAACVVLSACESARSHALEGDELIGLARAFLGAGAATLVVSQWLVHDVATALLMDEFYAALTSGSQPAAALRQAQRKLMQSYAHPYYWGPFILMGSN